MLMSSHDEPTVGKRTVTIPFQESHLISSIPCILVSINSPYYPMQYFALPLPGVIAIAHAARDFFFFWIRLIILKGRNCTEYEGYTQEVEKLVTLVHQTKLEKEKKQKLKKKLKNIVKTNNS